MDEQYLCTRADFEKAKDTIQKYFLLNGIGSRRELSAFKVFGLSYESIELAVRYLVKQGILEELYSLPTARRGQRKEYYALTTALETKSVELPEGVVRESKAFELIA